MKPNIPLAVRHLIAEYRRFLRTSYRFLDPQLREQFEAHLAQAEVVVRGPYVTLARDFARGRTLRALVEAGAVTAELLRARWPFEEAPLYLHQEKALLAGQGGRPFVVTTGTGSGKTEAFFLPVLDGILRRKRDGVSGLQAVFLYPMNALANDQLERMRALLRGTGLDVSFALYTGDSDTATRNLREEPAEKERLSRAAIRRQPPDILLTNYKQLEFLLVRAEDRPLFTPALHYLVLDEIHSYRGALATEIACLIRRLKAHADVASGGLVGIGTSATVASGAGGADALAGFATILFGEQFRAEDVIGESLAPRPPAQTTWLPATPTLEEADILGVDPENDVAVVHLAERLTGRRCPEGGPLADRIAAVLAGNAVVEALEEACARPVSIADTAATLRARFPDRQAVPDEAVRREIEAYLLVGSIGDEANPPRLRPKLHTFFHGVYDVALCLNPECRALVPQGGAQCPACGAAARPAALCRTCGQDFVKLRFEREQDDLPVGTGDFYSDEHTAFVTHRVHELPEAPGEDEGPEGGEEAERAPTTGRREEAEDRLDAIGLCAGCGPDPGRRRALSGVPSGDGARPDSSGSAPHLPGLRGCLHQGRHRHAASDRDGIHGVGPGDSSSRPSRRGRPEALGVRRQPPGRRPPGWVHRGQASGLRAPTSHHPRGATGRRAGDLSTGATGAALRPLPSPGGDLAAGHPSGAGEVARGLHL